MFLELMRSKITITISITDANEDAIQVVNAEGCACDHINLLRPLHNQPTCVYNLS